MQQLTPIHATSKTGPNTFAMLCHILGFAGYMIPFGGIIGPLVLWLIKKDESPLIDAHGKEAVNFQISIAIYSLAAVILVFVLIGIPLVLAVTVFNVVCIIRAAIAANKGESWTYPLSLRLVK